ncbi:hypothetical protein [Streptomonospora wellingtoniae]|uniref:Uncharacterized protein n=1 Tax=Streptomonospora wellingtoniae TaxID=3075544 RepID=A0ABU2L1F5_9ACTN|nr:hypothetical protein [Streptomonospora sp. DSM 45055]MDT0305093.1 hypothetical protein [Streptomonospora sp. DSM 45055]
MTTTRTGDSLHDAHAILNGATGVDTTMVALARATIADRAAGDAADLLAMLGLDLATGGPRVRLADLDERPDLELPRAAEGSSAAALVADMPLTPQQQASRARARQVVEAAVRHHLAELGWPQADIDLAVADLDGGEG